MSKKLFVALALCLMLLAVANPTLAQTDQKIDVDVISQLQAEGWRIVSEGVLQRASREGEVETFVFGVRGFTWKLRDLRSQLQKLQTELRFNPTSELRKAIASHRKEIANTRKMIERARIAEASKVDLSKVSCSIDFSYDASATARTDVRGTKATSNAAFTANCAGFTGEVYAYAFAKTWLNGAETTETVTDGPRSGANVSATATATRSGATPCESYAYASMTSNNLNPASYSKSSTNTSCPVITSALAVSVTSPSSSVTLWDGACTSVTWTVNISGGTPAYASSIYSNNTFKKTGTSYTETVCGFLSNSSRTITVRADVTDSSSPAQFQTASHTLTVYSRKSTTTCCTCPDCVIP
ncbi:MAG TPA: hypothetical protein VLE27_05615 [Thermoanaerobaculia bacterium]|nr:hypothetical protein [Thermoanaerobaculia bacterium]